MMSSHYRDLERGGNAAALALFATDSLRGTSNDSAESQSAAVGCRWRRTPNGIQNDTLPSCVKVQALPRPNMTALARSSQSRFAPGFPSSTTKVAVVETEAQGVVTPETTRKFVSKSSGFMEQRTKP